jgi:hypothetical protein
MRSDTLSPLKKRDVALALFVTNGVYNPRQIIKAVLAFLFHLAVESPPLPGDCASVR